MKESISALMDGEIASREEADKLLGAMGKDETLETAWDEYHLIGDALRNNALLSISVREQVAKRLADEPTVLAPQPSRSKPRVTARVATWALAASVSFAAVVAWQVIGKQSAAAGASDAQQVAAATPTPTPSASDNSYLLAHQEMAADPSVDNNLMKASVSEVQH